MSQPRPQPSVLLIDIVNAHLHSAEEIDTFVHGLLSIRDECKLLYRSCSKCGDHKPRSEFDHHMKMCKCCRSKYNHAYWLTWRKNRRAAEKLNKVQKVEQPAGIKMTA